MNSPLVIAPPFEKCGGWGTSVGTQIGHRRKGEPPASSTFVLRLSCVVERTVPARRDHPYVARARINSSEHAHAHGAVSRVHSVRKGGVYMYKRRGGCVHVRIAYTLSQFPFDG